VRGIFVSIAHNLGIDFESAKNLLEEHLEEEELALCSRLIRSGNVAASPIDTARAESEPSCLPARFDHPLGGPMLLISAGEFMMGSEEIDAAPNERPLTPVTLSDFYMSLHPVTNAQYEQFDPSHRRKRMPGAGDTNPVVYVTSLDAMKFSQWLGKQDGKKYRLPTEAEWEYAARGTDGRKYPWGNDADRGDLANFADASTTFAWRHPILNDGYPESSPVGAFPGGASFFGVEEMAGNVWEWCLEFLQPLSGRPKRNPRGAAVGTQRVCRGGSWKSRFSNLRTTARSSNAPNHSSNDLGFRIVCETASNASAKSPPRACEPSSPEFWDPQDCCGG
jgi:formylglycine-generating enzyme required for sulfatase activity